MQKGKVGPDHATHAARMQIFDAAQDSHDLSERQVPGHRLFIAVPRGRAPQAGWPVLYMLDGNAAFDFLTPEHLAMAAGLVLVGVGYDTDRQFARERRTFDFTPPDGPDGVRPDHVHEGRMAGGAGRFLDQLTGPLRAEAERGLPVDPARRALWGHSFGGLFTLFAYLTQPKAFARFAAISPSVWWDEGLMQSIARSARADAPLLLALSDAEKRSGADGPPPDGPAPATMALAALLRPDLHILPGLRHIDTLAASFPLALRFAQG
ncbi:alpha/beta hydrolase-fold protein [Cereibacter sp. SYSU M97828]|nr:alpha/beta hydrolase-fold protein [Cereibacter flavus]